MAPRPDDSSAVRSDAAVERCSSDPRSCSVALLAPPTEEVAPDLLARRVHRAQPTARQAERGGAPPRHLRAARPAAPTQFHRAYLTVGELCARWDCSRATLYRWIDAGYVPRPVRFGPRAVRWAAKEIEEFESHLASDRGAR